MVAFAGTIGALLVIYLCTLAPEVTLENSGTLVTDANYAGVTYPPGFPVWTVYSYVFVHLVPFGNIAWRVAVGSAFAAAFSCGLVALCVSTAPKIIERSLLGYDRLTPKEQTFLRTLCGYVGGMSLGLSRQIWGFAVVADVWAVGFLLFTTTLCLVMRWVFYPEELGFLYGALLCFGLLLTSNQEMLISIPAILFSVLIARPELGRDMTVPTSVLVICAWTLYQLGFLRWLGAYCFAGNVWFFSAFVLILVAALFVAFSTRRFGSKWRQLLICCFWFLLGLCWYFYIPIASMSNPPSNSGYGRTIAGFLHIIGRGQYEGYNPTRTPGELAGQLWMLLRETGKGYGWPYLVACTVPLMRLFWLEQKFATLLAILAAHFICVGPMMIAALNPSDGKSNIELITPYFAPMCAVLALWSGLSFLLIGSWAQCFGKSPLANQSVTS